MEICRRKLVGLIPCYLIRVRLFSGLRELDRKIGRENITSTTNAYLDSNTSM